MNAQAQEKTAQMHWEKLITSKRFGMEQYHDDRHHTVPIFNAIMTDWCSRPRFVDYRTKHRYFLCQVASSSITD